MTGLTLTPVTGTLLVLVMIVCGRQFRENWKAQSAGWVRRAWAYGAAVVISFALLAFVPLTA